MNQIPLSIFDLSIFLVYQISLLLIRLHYIYIYMYYYLSNIIITYYILLFNYSKICFYGFSSFKYNS